MATETLQEATADVEATVRVGYHQGGVASMPARADLRAMEQ